MSESSRREQESRREAVRAQAKAERSAKAARREKIGSRITIVAALLISLITGGFVYVQSLTQSEANLQSARADTGRGARADLDEANRRLLARGLPVFEVPDFGSPNYQIQRQAARAWAMSDYPEPLAQQVRDEVAAGTRPGAIPAFLSGPEAAETRILPDGRVVVIPINPGGDEDDGDAGTTTPPGLAPVPAPVRTASPPAAPPGTTRPPTTRPAPAPTTTRPPGLLGPLFPLLPPVGPIRIPPLIGAT